MGEVLSHFHELSVFFYFLNLDKVRYYDNSK